MKALRGEADSNLAPGCEVPVGAEMAGVDAANGEVVKVQVLRVEAEESFGSKRPGRKAARKKVTHEGFTRQTPNHLEPHPSPVPF